MSVLRNTLFAALLALGLGCSQEPPKGTDAAGKSQAAAQPDGNVSVEPKDGGSAAKGGPEAGAPKTEPPIADDPNLGKVTGGSGQEYTLRVNVPSGWKRTYTFTVDTFIDPRALKPGDPLLKTAPVYSTVKVVGEMEVKLASSGGGRWNFVNTPKILSAVGTGSWKQQADEMLKAPPEPQKYTWDERMRNVNIAKEEYVDPLTNTLNGLLPKNPVKVGSSWSYKPFPKATIDSKVRVEKVETISGIETLKLNIDTPSATEGEKSQFIVWLEPKTGMYVRTELHIGGNQKGLVSKNDFIQTLKK